MCSSVESGCPAATHAALPPCSDDTGALVNACASPIARPARMPSSEVSTSSPRSGMFGSASLSRERIAYHAPGI
jgi:hypothetical protein